MAGISPQGARFTFNVFASDPFPFYAIATSLSIQTPSAEVVDMTGYEHGATVQQLVPTGQLKGGSIDVEYIWTKGGEYYGTAFTDPSTMVRCVGQLKFWNGNLSITRQAILESASSAIKSGDVVRGSLRFVLTDYYKVKPNDPF